MHYILQELVMGGMVLETNMTEILTRIEEQSKLEKNEVRAIHSDGWYGINVSDGQSGIRNKYDRNTHQDRGTK